MSIGYLLFISFLYMIFSSLPLDLLKNNKLPKLGILISFSGLITALFWLCVGIFLISGWESPLQNLDAETVAKGRGRGGIVVVMIHYFPYASIILGSLFSFGHYSSLKTFWHMIKEHHA